MHLPFYPKFDSLTQIKARFAVFRTVDARHLTNQTNLLKIFQ